ncbi:MAG TPA: hypothetical protein VN231_01260 [Allosphingosinicella sp.]|nr:hypothetical protein [Allosphingosinicella sp.]
MNKSLGLLPALLLGGCETARERPYNPVDNVRYSAIGQEPFWLATIGDDRIVLRLGRGGGGPEAAEHEEIVYPRTLPRTQDGWRTWESRDGTAVITIQARPGPCRGSGERLYEDDVRVRLSGRELSGCGGRLVERGDD